MTTCTVTLDLGDGRTFTTADARWDGEYWNGFPAVQLPTWQAYALSLLLGETSPDDASAVPHVDHAAHEEADYVWMDGLCWERVPDAVLTAKAQYEAVVRATPEDPALHTPQHRAAVREARDAYYRALAQRS
jgi:hypothetical protein